MGGGEGVDERKSVHEYAVCMSYFSANMLGEKADCLKKLVIRRFLNLLLIL